MKKFLIVFTIVLFLMAVAGVCIAHDAHCHSKPCHASCRCCAKYNPKECPRCGCHCGKSN